MLPTEIVAEYLAGQRLSVVLHWQIGDLLQVPGQIQRTAHGEISPDRFCGVLPGHVGCPGDRQQRIQAAGTGHHTCQQFRHAGIDVGLVVRLSQLVDRPSEQLVELQAEGGDARAETGHVAYCVQLVTAVAEEPADGTAIETHQFVHQDQLDINGHLVVEALSLVEPVRQVERIANDHVGPDDVGRAYAGEFLQTLHEGDVHVAGQAISDLHTDDFVPQAMAVYSVVELLRQ